MAGFLQSPVGVGFLPTPNEAAPSIATTHHDYLFPLSVATTTTEPQTPILDFNLFHIIENDCSSSSTNSHSNQVAPLQQHRHSILAVNAVGSVSSTPSIISRDNVFPLAILTESQPLNLPSAPLDEIDEFLMSLDYESHLSMTAGIAAVTSSMLKQ